MEVDMVGSELAEFRERQVCISCGGNDLRPIWKGRFCDEPVSSWIQAMHYSGNVTSALGSNEFVRIECGNCRISFHQRILSDQWLRTLYSDWISSEQISAFEGDYQQSSNDAIFIEGTQNIKHLLRLRHLLRKQAHRPLRLLDFGCGDGKFLRAGTMLGFDAFGVDPSTSRRARAESGGITIAACLDDLADIEKFDCVTLFEVLEHVAEPRGILESVRGRMSDDGVLLIEVPNCQGIVTPKTFEEFGAVQPLEHINHFTPETLIEFCRGAGFSPAPRVPAHVTTDPIALFKTEASRFWRRAMTSQYFRRA